MCRDEDGWNSYTAGGLVLVKLHSIHLRHLKIHDQAFGETIWQRREEFSSGTKVMTRKDRERNNRLKARSTAESSSTMAMHGDVSATRNPCPLP